MGIISVILGINLYVLLMAFFHKMFADKHGGFKAFILGNIIVLATLILGLMIYY